MVLETGALLKDRYRIEALLGEGGMGAVYRAFDMLHNQRCALKECRLEGLPSAPAPSEDDTQFNRGKKAPALSREKALAQFKREAQLLARLDHANLPKVFDYFSEGNDYYLAMTLIEGRNLALLIYKQGAQSWATAAPWVQQLLEALAYCHAQGVIHRDIKPANVILTPQGRACLVDFGIAKPDEPGGHTTVGARAATPGYSPPEQYGGHGRTDARSDIYSLGALLYTLVTGQDPVEAIARVTGEAELTPPENTAPDLPRPVAAAIVRAMGLRPAERFQTVAELQAALFAPGTPPSATKATAPARKAGPPAAAAQVLTLAMPPTLKEAESEHWLPADLPRLVRIPEPPEAVVWIGRYPVTNTQYARFLEAPDFAAQAYWVDFPKFDERGQALAETWGEAGWKWLQAAQQDKKRSPDGQHVRPGEWGEARFGAVRPGAPVVSVTWYEANAYCRWLLAHWDELDEAGANPDLRPAALRLPTEAEWVRAAGGAQPSARFPWDPPGQASRNETDILHRANVGGAIGRTTPVGLYPQGVSQPYGLLDMAGNVWEWLASYFGQDHDWLALRGGAWPYHHDRARMTSRYSYPPDSAWHSTGFRIAALG
jgi:serine/threonine-protein kinase